MAAPVLLREAITAPACGTATYSRAPHATQCSSISTTSEGSEPVLFVMIPLPFLACCELNQSILSRLVFFFPDQALACTFPFSLCYHRPFYCLLMASYRSVTTCKRLGMVAS